MTLALSGLSGLSGICTSGASITPDPGTGQKYWDKGLPSDGLRNDALLLGDQKYWRDGLPFDYLAIA